MTSAPLPTDFQWYHAVNDQSKLTKALELIRGQPAHARRVIHAIEADIIYSEPKCQAVMGHPPNTDGDLTLVSFLDQLREIKFQHVVSKDYSVGVGGGHDGCDEYDSVANDVKNASHILKLDFKSMQALQSNLNDVKNYVDDLPPFLHDKVWINADILAGPGEDLNDEQAQLLVKPNFIAKEFLNVVTSQFPGAVLSIGWKTSLTDIFAIYTDEMVDHMIQCLEPHSENLHVTFPVRATSFRKSWGALRKLYEANDNWTVTLWWSLNELSVEEMDWIYETLEIAEELFKNRTYYDLVGFADYLVRRGRK